MADVLLHLGLIYAAIALLCCVLYVVYNRYSNKAVLINAAKKTSPVTKTTATQKVTDIIEPENSIAQNIEKENVDIKPTAKENATEIKEPQKAIEQIAEKENFNIKPTATEQATEITVLEKNIEQGFKKEWHAVQSGVTEQAIETKTITSIPEKKQNEIEEEINPIEKKITPAAKIKSVPDFKFQPNENDNIFINGQNNELTPQLNFFSQGIQAGKKLNAGLIKTTFYFGSEDGFYIINPTIDITFETKFDYISAGITSTVPGSSCNLPGQSFNNNTRVLVTTNFLQAGNRIFIQVISRQNLQIADIKITPIDPLLLPVIFQQK